MLGNRREDMPYFTEPDDAQPGDYWRCLNRRTPATYCRIEEAGYDDRGENLTGGVWGVKTPNGIIGLLVHHTVREHEDGTISIRPGDGSSNSILCEYPPHARWHGYIEHGVWQPLGDCHGEVPRDGV